MQGLKLFFLGSIINRILWGANQSHSRLCVYQFISIDQLQLFEYNHPSMPKLKKYSGHHSDPKQPHSDYSIGQFQILKPNGPPNHDASDRSRNSGSASQASSSRSAKKHSTLNLQNSTLAAAKLGKQPVAKGRNTTHKKNKTKFDADSILRKVQQECAKDEPSDKDQHDSETGFDIPDNVLVGYQDRKSRGRKATKTIKVKNKFFEHVAYQECADQAGRDPTEEEAEELKQLEEEHKNILASRNEKNALLTEERKKQIQSRVHKIRQRLNFKNAYEDNRFKEHIKQTLKEVRDCDEIQIAIEPPKIFKGCSARQTDAALFIKNLAYAGHLQAQPEENLHKSQQKEREKENENKNKRVDRRQFYQQFTRHIKEARAQHIPSLTGHLFKTTSLEQVEKQLEKHQHLFQQDGNSKISRNSLNSRRSQPNFQPSNPLQNQNQRRSRQHSQSKRQMPFPDRVQNQKMLAVKEDAPNEDSKMHNRLIQQQNESPKNKGKVDQLEQIEAKQALKALEQKQILSSQIKEVEEKAKIKKNQEKKERKLKPETQKRRATKQKIQGQQPKKSKKGQVSKKIKQLFQEEAEDSQNGYGDDGHSSEEGDNSSVQSIIDRKQVKYVVKNEREARKKFIADQIKKDEELLLQIRQRITGATKIKCEESSQSRQRRKKRIAEAKRKFEEEDGSQKQKFENVADKDNPPSEEGGQSSRNNDFSKQLKDLEDDLMKKKDQQKEEPKQSSLAPHKSRKTVWQEMNIKTTKLEPDINHEKRGGFLNNTKAVQGGKIKRPRKSTSKSKNINF